MKKHNLIIWLSLLIVFSSNQLLERLTNVRVPFLYSYLDDLLAVPLTLLTYQWMLSLLKNNAYDQLPISVVIICIIGFAFHFELLMPILSNKYTADAVDVSMYTAGGLFYIISCNWNRIKILSQ